jgi:hypothetical protein
VPQLAHEVADTPSVRTPPLLCDPPDDPVRDGMDELLVVVIVLVDTVPNLAVEVDPDNVVVVAVVFGVSTVVPDCLSRDLHAVEDGNDDAAAADDDDVTKVSDDTVLCADDDDRSVDVILVC